MKGFLYGFALATVLGIGSEMVSTARDLMLPTNPGMLDDYMLQQQREDTREQQRRDWQRRMDSDRRNPC